MKALSERKSASSPASWTRPAVTLRLTEKRKRGLASLLGEANALASPTEALDLAIELAAINLDRDREFDECEQPSASGCAEAFDRLRTQTYPLGNAFEDWNSAWTQLARVAAECAELRAVIANCTTPAGPFFVNSAPPIALRSWLDMDVNSSTAWLVAKIHWMGKQPAGGGMSIWDVELRELKRGPAAHEPKPRVARVVIGPASTVGPLSNIECVGTSILLCVRIAGGWTLSLRSSGEDGKLGEPFAELSI